MLLERDGHVVAQVVEAELGVRAVGDVRLVGLLRSAKGIMFADERGPDAQRLVDRPHPLGVALREVVVDRHEVDVVAGSAFR